MASPQQPYSDDQPDPEGQDGGYEQQEQAAAAPAAGGKKKRAYAGQAYEFGAGANSALGGQQPGGAQYPGSAPQTAGYGYPGAQQAQTQQPSYGMPQQPQYGDGNYQSQPAQPAQPAYGQPPYGQPQGGYEPPQASYPAPGQQGVQQATQQFQQMSIGGGPAPVAGQPAQQQGQMRLNPLQPVDISMQGQPFHVTDLDQAPPAIILPPNVSYLFIVARIILTYWPVLGDTISSRQLPAQVCQINTQRNADYCQSAQEEQATFRAHNSAICNSP